MQWHKSWQRLPFPDCLTVRLSDSHTVLLFDCQLIQFNTTGEPCTVVFRSLLKIAAYADFVRMPDRLTVFRF